MIYLSFTIESCCFFIAPEEVVMNRIIALMFEECEGNSPIAAHLPTADGAMMVFPSHKSESDMVEPGWYVVQLTFLPGKNFVLADPVMTEINIEAAADILNCHLDLDELRRSTRRKSRSQDHPRVAAA